MRRALPVLAVAVLLAGPTVLAFYSGGFFAEQQRIAAIVAWLLVLAVAVFGPAPLPARLPGRLALGGLALITAWSACSIAWAPLQGQAGADVQRLLLYVGALLLAIGVLRGRRLMRAVEPALAAGATIVIAYGLAGRLLPGVLHFARSLSAGGRLEQPITYWNGEGALAAVGLVLCARLAGDRTRPAPMRALAGAAAAPLGAAVYLSYSRGAIAVAVVGLVILVAAAPVRAQLHAALVALVAGVAAAACSSAFPGVASLSGSLGDRERGGAIMLVILVLLAGGAAALTARRAVAERRGRVRDGVLLAGRWPTAIAGAAVGLVAVGLVVGGLQERSGSTNLAGANATRLTSVSSNRYDYWRVGLRAFLSHPVHGLGAGGFRVAWLRERPIHESVQDVHSLELEMATELGIVGLLAFGLMIAGAALAARRALQRHPAAAVGPCAATIAWLLHASIDWDWQLPAVSLPAIVLAGALVALSEIPAEERAAAPAVRADTSASAALPIGAAAVGSPPTTS